ncbi:NAD(P)H-dependent glycerol-3-phosphate dehydrogenase [Oceanivirga miroungae]|uniref:Glycerol-3-phosphate dehydrogenase [NAD(P)+] n=1 Tax=Oceanivirga miroungae TaxID=1130046 RepID=A0A6I8MB04_9FUSO|nr:NAD(P)H-dependent glycerol-3-phosphate dehydrogenase [Oceanivirga miroungae]VWL85438.1 glycerol-3-phosphate dehydrogenase (NAD(P)(+)) [Oceanivirga miroungae]
MKILVIGGGSFGTSLSVVLSKKNYNIYLYEHNKEYREDLRKYRENKVFLKGFKLDENINIIDDYNDYVNDVDIVLLTTPTQFVRSILENMKLTKKDQIIVNVAKGIEIKTLKTISQIVDELLGDITKNYVLLTGPTHAEEIALNKPSAILAVSNNEKVAKFVQESFSTEFLRIYTGTDILGSEYSGALKNCIAISAGICDGLEYGDNTKAALMTRGFNEMVIIGEFFGGSKETFSGLSGLGDLIVTCTSKHSRNRYVGEKLGRGYKLDEITSSMKMVSEGVSTIKALKKIIDDNNLRAPIFTELYNILYNNQSVNTVTKILMSRDLKSEF